MEISVVLVAAGFVLAIVASPAASTQSTFSASAAGSSLITAASERAPGY